MIIPKEMGRSVVYWFHMIRISVSFEFNQKISSTLSILLILLLSTLVALLVLRAAKSVIDTAESAPAFHLEKRTGELEILNAK